MTLSYYVQRPRAAACLAFLLIIQIIPLGAAELLSYYDFDGSTDDQSGNGAHATLAGGASISGDGQGFTSTLGDHSLDLGPSRNAARADVNGADFSAGTLNDAMAVSFWQYNIGDGGGGNASTTPFGLVSSSGGGGRGFQTHTPWGDGNLYFDHGGACCNAPNRRSVSVGTRTLDKWVHVVVQVAGGMKQIWVDGVMLDEQANGAAAIPTFTGQLMIGAEPAGTNNGFGGRIDEFAVWSSFLTPTEIAQLAAKTPTLEIVDGNNSDLPTLTVTPASGVSATLATLNGEVTGIGIEAPAITVFYGDEDGGKNPAAWDTSVNLPGVQSGQFSANVVGLAPATTYFFAARGTNAAGERWASDNESFTTLPLAPTVGNIAASAVEADSATVGATITDTGGEVPAVTIYYGPADAGTSAETWASSVFLSDGDTTITGLAQGTTYFFRAFAANSGGSGWAATSESFTTPVPAPASVVNRSASDVTGSSARLRGTVTEPGGDTPTLTFFYGISDGGTDPGAWGASVSVGEDSGDFSRTVTRLTPETDYYFRALAVNSAGTTWAPNSESFTTTVATSLGVVINEVHYDADPKTERAEFVELVNAGDVTIDLSGWRLMGVGNYLFPGGTALAPGEFLVVAEDSATMVSKFGVTTIHQYTGSLDSNGDDLRLLDSGGAEIDRVNYRDGFPWPTAARGTGASMELIHTALDNDLGGSWRSAGSGPVGPSATFLSAGSIWNYRKGTSEASAPMDAWRKLSFVEDGTWLPGTGIIGYGDGDDITVLDDMNGGYSSLYLRKTFNVPVDQIPARLAVRVYVDDGAIVWINGTEVARISVSAGDKAFDDFGDSHERAWEEVVINNASNILVGGTNIIAIHALNASLGSSDFSIDAELRTPDSAASGDPTPAAANSASAANPSAAPPAIRQVGHSPVVPAGGQEVLVTAKVTDPDGVGSVILSYQLVDPGDYIRKSDAAYETTWIDLPMRDDGNGGDALANDDVFTAIMPEALQVHRRLIRYRITVEDALGTNVRVPYGDDESPNFAYFVYDGVPAWTGAKQPGSTAAETVPASVMADQLPVYHLVANSSDVTNSQYNGGSDGVRMWGSLVYDGKVYDHIQFYNRGEASTYVSGKNKWRFKFNRSRDFEARDIYGQAYKATWKTMNFNSCSSPWLASQRGMAGLNEAVPHRLHQLAGVTSSNTHFVHFRIVDDSTEAPSDQFSGDLWGLYLAIEHPDGRLLDEFDLPDGNLYKIQGGGGDKKNQGPMQTEGSGDWSTFYAASANLNSVAWWRENFHLDSYYSFRAINRATGNVDLRDHTNYYMYHHPDDRWRVIPWDLDMMYAPVKHVWSGVIQADRCLDHPEIATEFRNRCRELGDLLFSDANRSNGHAAQVVEELSQIVNPVGVPLTMVDVDEFMWSFHPRTTGPHRGPWYPLVRNETRLQTNYVQTLNTPDHEGFQQNLIDYMYDVDPTVFFVNDRDEDGYGWGYLAQEAADNAIPDKPTITYTGDGGFPANGLRFSSSAFAGGNEFATMQWRIGRISNPSTPDYFTDDPWVYEIEAAWQSENPLAEMTIPASAARPGETYRARVRHLDATGRASHWSEPVEFVTAVPDVAVYQDSLVISEVMYHPAGDRATEFIELHNVGGNPVDLTGVRFTKGIDFDFADGTTIQPGEFLLVVANLAGFELQYGAGLPVAGEWQIGDQLSNGGETLKLSLGAGTAIHEFAYDDVLPWPTTADGEGYSLTLANVASGIDHAAPNNWRASVSTGGSPGTADEVSLADWLAANGLSPGDELTDSDGDGLSALLEYASGSDPNIPDSEIGNMISFDDGFPTLSYLRSKSANGVTITVEFSSDLITWKTAGETISITPTGTDGIERRSVRSPDSVTSHTPQFARLKALVKP